MNEAVRQSGGVTRLLTLWTAGDEHALAELMPIVYDELHDLARALLRRERGSHTLQPTALVNEAYIRLTGLRAPDFKNRVHFFGASASAMRRILVDHARRRGAAKRGDSWRRVSLDDVPATGFGTDLDFVALDDALLTLRKVAPRAEQVVELRCFGGLSIEEAATCLAIAPATVKRDWAFARAWLHRALRSA